MVIVIILIPYYEGRAEAISSQPERSRAPSGSENAAAVPHFARPSLRREQVQLLVPGPARELLAVGVHGDSADPVDRRDLAHLGFQSVLGVF